jgi:hypothetical protein
MSRSLIPWGPLVLLHLACGSDLPTPRIVGVSPSLIVQGTSPEVRMDLDAVFPFTAAYDQENFSIDTQVAATLGGLPLRNTGLVSNGDVIGLAPLELPLGDHEARVELADGRAAVLRAAVTVEAGAFPDSFAIDPIPVQNRGEAFTIFIHAIGGRATEFAGVVRISLSRGVIVPDLSGPFAAGERVESVTILSAGTGVWISVEDALGHTGASNPFNVN